MSQDENPFLRYGLDPAADLASITERLRELAEDTHDPTEREAIRAAWDALTLRPMRRLELALDVSPAPAPLPPLPAREADPPAFVPLLEDLLAPAPVAPRLPSPTDAEARLLEIDLSFLVRDDEAEATGPLVERGRAPTASAPRGAGAKR